MQITDILWVIRGCHSKRSFCYEIRLKKKKKRFVLKLGLKSNPVYRVQNHKVFLTKSQWKSNITVQLMYALQLKTKKETETIFRSDECRAEQEYKASAHMAYCLCVF